MCLKKVQKIEVIKSQVFKESSGELVEHKKTKER